MIMFHTNPYKLKNAKSCNHFFAKYAITSQISSLILLILPYPEFLVNKGFTFLFILIIVLFVSSVVAIGLEHLFENDPFNFRPPVTKESINHLYELLEEYAASLEDTEHPEENQNSK